MSSQKTYLLVIGSGPGIGLATAQHFAANKTSSIVLFSRNSTRLAEDKANIESSLAKSGVDANSVQIRTVPVDVADLPALRSALASLSDFGRPECIFFNAARVRATGLLADTAEEISYDFSITNLALYEVAKWGLPQLVGLAEEAAKRSDGARHVRPSLIVTSSLLHVYPMPDLVSLSVTKVAQRTLVKCLSDQYSQLGVHVALISIGGQVDDKFETMNARVIAERVWKTYRQERGNFTFDVMVLEGMPSNV